MNMLFLFENMPSMFLFYCPKVSPGRCPQCLGASGGGAGGVDRSAATTTGGCGRGPVEMIQGILIGQYNPLYIYMYHSTLHILGIITIILYHLRKSNQRQSVWWWLEHGFYVSIYLDCHRPNWRTHIFQRGWNHQPDMYHSTLHILGIIINCNTS